MVQLCSSSNVVLSDKMTPKLKDSGSIFIPCTIGTYYFGKALCVSGYGINLSSFSIYKNIGLGSMRKVDKILQFADGSIKKSKGIIDDVLMKIDNIVFHANFFD